MIDWQIAWVWAIVLVVAIVFGVLLVLVGYWLAT